MSSDERREEDLAAALDFRRQLQDRFPAYAGDRTPELVQDWIKTRDEWLKEILRKSFGNKTDFDVIAELKQTLERTELETPRDEPFTHAIVIERCTEIERACRDFKVSLRGGVSYGVIPTFELEAARFPVLMTEASVIQISAGMISFCSHISKVSSMSLIHESVADGFRVNLDHRAVFSNVGKNAQLKKSWTEVIGGYAFGSGPMKVEQFIVPFPQAKTRAQLLIAMERFAIAHEYAHHVEGGIPPETISVDSMHDGKKSEFDADLFGAFLVRFMEREEAEMNPYAISGAGAVLLLKCLDCVQKARRIFETGSDARDSNETHPSLEARISLLCEELDDGVSKENKLMFQQMRMDLILAVDAIWLKLRPWFVDMHRSGLRPESSLNDGWLPR